MPHNLPPKDLDELECKKDDFGTYFDYEKENDSGEENNGETIKSKISFGSKISIILEYYSKKNAYSRSDLTIKHFENDIDPKLLRKFVSSIENYDSKVGNIIFGTFLCAGVIGGISDTEFGRNIGEFIEDVVVEYGSDKYIKKWYQDYNLTKEEIKDISFQFYFDNEYDELLSFFISEGIYTNEDLKGIISDLINKGFDSSTLETIKILDIDYIQEYFGEDIIKLLISESKIFILYELYKRDVDLSEYSELINIRIFSKIHASEEQMLMIIKSGFFSRSQIQDHVDFNFLVYKGYYDVMFYLVSEYYFQQTDFSNMGILRNLIQNKQYAIVVESIIKGHFDMMNISIEFFNEIKTENPQLFERLVIKACIKKMQCSESREMYELIGEEIIIHESTASGGYYHYEFTGLKKVFPFTYEKELSAIANLDYIRSLLNNGTITREEYNDLRNTVDRAIFEIEEILKKRFKKSGELYEHHFAGDWETMKDSVDVIDVFTGAKKKVVREIIQEGSEKWLGKKVSKEQADNLFTIISMLLMIGGFIIWVNKEDKK